MRKKRLSQGFTLIEALIAALIMGVGALSFSNLHTRLAHSSSLSKQNDRAQIIAQQKIEQLRNYSSLTNFDAIASGNDTITAENTSFNRNWTVTNNSAPDYKTVQVTVSWQTTEGTNESLTLDSSIARHDPKDSGTAISSSENVGGLSP